MSVKRNSPCPCGSGKKFKKCCVLLQNESQPSSDQEEQARTLVDQGNVLLGAEKHEEALKLYQKALSVYPEYARAHYNIGVVLQKTGRKEDALSSYQKVLAITPDDVEAYVNMGVLLNSLDNIEEAAICYRKALAIKPDHAEAHNNLGLAYLSENRLSEAKDCFLKSQAIKPDQPGAYNNLGIIYLRQDRLSEAEASLLKALAVKTDHSEALNNLGVVYQKLGRLSEAEACLLKTLSNNPDNFKAHFSLADIYERKNLTHKAKEHLVKSLSHDSGNLNYLMLEAQLLFREKNYPGALEKLHFLENSIQDNAKLSAAVYFLLGKIYDRVGEENNAFDSFIKANNINSKEAERKNINPAVFVDQVVTLKRRFTVDWIDSWTDIALDNSRTSKSPIFLMGFPRSGTTLLDQVLSTHSQVEVVEEKPLLIPVQNRVSQLPGGFPDALASFDANNVYELQQLYFEEIEPFLPDNLENKVVVDKFPLNIVDAGMVNRIFPDARIILALRHPYDVCLSNFMQNFQLNPAMANFHAMESSARIYAHVMGLWQQYANLLDINFHIIRYEDVVSDFEREIRGLLSFLALPWEEGLLNYHRHTDKRSFTNTPSYQDISSPIFSRAKYRWKRYEKYFEGVKEILAPHVEYFGYTVEFAE
ncbi:MAG: tetratricopeptide repeat protein [Thermodesulfobacteriota bacterium]